MAVQIANIIFDQSQRILRKGDQTRSLEPKVFSLLTTLLAADGAIVTRDELIVEVWNNRIVGEGAINRTVSLLRAHFLALTKESIIETVPTQGYRLTAHTVEMNEAPLTTVENITDSPNLSPRFFNAKSIGFIAIIMALLSLFYWYLSQANNENNHDKLSLISGPLIGLKGWEYKVSSGSSGQEILFHHLDENNKQSVYLYDTNTHTKRLVLNDALAVINADAKRIAYVTYKKNQCTIGLYDVNTSKKQTLFSCDKSPTSLVWGQADTFYFNKRFSKSHPYQVFSYNVNTSQLRQITKPSSENNTKGDFRFSYNQQTNQLAVVRYINENKSKVIVFNKDSSQVEHIVDLRINNLVWHPNNHALIVADKTSLYALSTTDGQYQLLKQLAFDINSLAIIDDEAAPSLLISSENMMSDIVKFDIKNNQQTLWQQSARSELMPRIQSETQLVLSTRYKSHHWWKINKGSATLIDVEFPFDLQFVRYELSDDGKRVLFTKHGSVYELDLDEASYEVVFPESKNSYVANYDSRNAQDLIYSSNHTGQWQLWSYLRANDEHHQLTSRGGYSGRIIGEYLYYSKFTVDGLWRKKLSETTEELVLKDFNRINWLNWQLINNQLYFYREETGIWQFDIETGTQQLVMATPDDFVHQYTVSPDQQHIYWVRLKPIEGDIYHYNLNAKGQ